VGRPEPAKEFLETAQMKGAGAVLHPAAVQLIVDETFEKG
jgi:hypothetical protein